MASLVGTAAHTNRVCMLYKRALRQSLHWMVFRESWHSEIVLIRAEIEKNRHERNEEKIEQLVSDFEKELDYRIHPSPYIIPENPGGTKWQRNVPPPTFTCDMKAYGGFEMK
mmetsp:Transcript_3259/g.8818  ORF Transcript_3259/g.8818 Transcript_3259/m.8818 type:complete len:112 (-) Transcript_3259:104-439(-)|eukprot:CAMPEP_0119120866 /NCGR_PEP_ID=MMETSP1310-20130426/1733_1 /TAXON_ID=464262 /ORGANISM="Genus nov. species nov., Strain RCC2339" /LENGTH=111 /DNA_ID=CAMNT_0007110373 /DNA_START=67 /DNA_END=402 /DNA_ORIENTATION=+